MGLVTECDNCEHSWLVDSLTYIDGMEQNLCPNCVNQLVDLCWSRLSDAEIRQIKIEIDDL